MALTPEQRKASRLRIVKINEGVEHLDGLPAAIDKAAKMERFTSRSKLMKERAVLIGLLGGNDELIGGSPSQN